MNHLVELAVRQALEESDKGAAVAKRQLGKGMGRDHIVASERVDLFVRSLRRAGYDVLPVAQP